FCEGIGVAGAEFFSHAVGTHRAPFVVVAFKPDFKEVVEPAIFRDVLRRKMAMVVQDRLVFRVGVIQPSGGAGAQEEIFVDEFHNQFFTTSAEKESHEQAAVESINLSSVRRGIGEQTLVPASHDSNPSSSLCV